MYASEFAREDLRVASDRTFFCQVQSATGKQVLAGVQWTSQGGDLTRAVCEGWAENINILVQKTSPGLGR